MCMAASYWARLDRVVYAASRGDAAAAGFDDGLIAREMQLLPDERSLKTVRLDVDSSSPVRKWKEKSDKVSY